MLGLRMKKDKKSYGQKSYAAAVLLGRARFSTRAHACVHTHTVARALEVTAHVCAHVHTHFHCQVLVYV